MFKCINFPIGFQKITKPATFKCQKSIHYLKKISFKMNIITNSFLFQNSYSPPSTQKLFPNEKKIT